MPDYVEKGKYPDREFFWRVLNKIIPDWVDEYKE